MNNSSFVLRIIKSIESKYPKLVIYGYEDTFGDIHRWLICISDYFIYHDDEEFKKIANSWYKVANKQHVKILFCYSKPIEKKLELLANDDKLIMNC